MVRHAYSSVLNAGCCSREPRATTELFYQAILAWSPPAGFNRDPPPTATRAAAGTETDPGERDRRTKSGD